MPENLSQQAFKALQEQYYNAWFRYHPEQAVQTGVPGYEDKLRAYSDDDVGVLIVLGEKLISALDEMDFSALDEEQQIDYTVLYSAVSQELHQLLEMDWRYRCPQQYLPVDAIHQLLTRPVENLHQALKHRLQQIPDYLRGARSYLLRYPERIPASWLSSAIQEASEGVQFIRNLSRHPAVLAKFRNPARLQPVSDDAAAALDDFSRFLQHDLKQSAQGDFACGETHFQRLLNESHFLDITASQLECFGQGLLDKTRAQLEALVATWPGEASTVDEVLAEIREDYPKGGNDSLFSAYRQRMKAAKDFVIKQQLVTMPQVQSLKVVETPKFLRHEIPFAAYEEPTYRDPEQQGYYYVTPVVSEGHMLEHNWTSIDLTCVHEAYPGHHLQFVTANCNPSNSLPRLLNASATLYEGWALYCEDMMQEQGFLDKPQHQFIMLRDRLWRALRVILDVRLQTQGLGIDDAAQMMCDQLGFSIDQARADISWYTQSPTVPMSYAVGWALIRALREQQEQREDFNLQQFHDRLLSVGSCALPLVIKRAFGEEAWQQARDSVFN
ncbi:MAG: DUF885 domain-containing protein [Gammaproteobacteria bacterium]|nr:DUF885 domain-containing protein [Gammaproteobacteria bacterium]